MVALLARREREGLSLRQLSEDSGIALGTVAWWSWRLRQHAPVGRRSRKGGFVQVVAADACVDAEIAVRLDNGLVIEVRPGTDARWLREIVNALQSC